MTRTGSRLVWDVRPDLDGFDHPHLLGVTPSGRPIWSASGGAPIDVSSWIPIEYDSDVVQRVRMESVIEGRARRVVMGSKTKSIPRSAGVTVTVGTTYTDDASTNDEVTLTARRFISRVQIDEDDLADASTRMDVLGTKSLDWAISYADTFDNACLGVTATETGTATAPFTSAYKRLRSTAAGLGYTADDNYTTWDDDLISIAATPNGTSLYEKLSFIFKKVETKAYWSQPDMLVIAHPGWRDALRLCTDAQGRPIFTSGGGAPGNGTPDTLFQTPIAWSRGCKTSPVLQTSPTGNDLLYFVNVRYLARGDRSGPEVLTDDARAQDDNDNYAMKFRARRGFQLTHPNAAAVLERITD
ncbi:MAG TPA: phage major capsid protein [Kofleriaceae bacterium]